jgi:hypothetical protein
MKASGIFIYRELVDQFGGIPILSLLLGITHAWPERKRALGKS